MRQPWDHFHAAVELEDGTVLDIEGGWRSFPPGWDDMSEIQRSATVLQLVFLWSGGKDITK